MIIAVEGVDGAGKTTLFESLQLCMDARFVERLPLAEELFPYMHLVEERQVALWDALYDPSRTYVCDRSVFVSGPVYNELYGRPKVQYHPKWVPEIVVAYVDAPNDLLLRRLRERGDALFDGSRVQELKDIYAKHLKRFEWFCVDGANYPHEMVAEFFYWGQKHGIRSAR